MLMVCYFTVLLRVEVRRKDELAYARGRILVFGIREVSTPVCLPYLVGYIPDICLHHVQSLLS
jgi:hypothetical protein